MRRLINVGMWYIEITFSSVGGYVRRFEYDYENDWIEDKVILLNKIDKGLIPLQCNESNLGPTLFINKDLIYEMRCWSGSTRKFVEVTE